MAKMYYVEFTQYGTFHERYMWAMSETAIQEYLVDCVIHYIVMWYDSTQG